MKNIKLINIIIFHAWSRNCIIRYTINSTIYLHVELFPIYCLKYHYTDVRYDGLVKRNNGNYLLNVLKVTHPSLVAFGRCFQESAKVTTLDRKVLCCATGSVGEWSDRKQQLYVCLHCEGFVFLIDWSASFLSFCLKLVCFQIR